MVSKHVSLPSAFSEGDPTEWFKRFEICSASNDWDSAMRAKKMPTLLEGEALAVCLDLGEDDQKDYNEAKKKIIARLAPMSFVWLDNFQARRLRSVESLPVFVHTLKRLLGQAMPDVDEGTRRQLIGSSNYEIENSKVMKVVHVYRLRLRVQPDFSISQERECNKPSWQPPSVQHESLFEDSPPRQSLSAQPENPPLNLIINETYIYEHHSYACLLYTSDAADE